MNWPYDVSRDTTPQSELRSVDLYRQLVGEKSQMALCTGNITESRLPLQQQQQQSFEFSSVITIRVESISWLKWLNMFHFFGGFPKKIQKKWHVWSDCKCNHIKLLFRLSLLRGQDFDFGQILCHSAILSLAYTVLL